MPTKGLSINNQIDSALLVHPFLPRTPSHQLDVTLATSSFALGPCGTNPGKPKTHTRLRYICSDPKPLRIAVSGCGRLGSYHVEKIHQLQQEAGAMPVVLCGAVDPSAERRNEVAARYGVRVAEDLHSFLEGLGPEEAPEALVVASPTDTHQKVGLQALGHAGGMHLLIEKPLAATPQEAEELVAVAKARGRVLQVGHSERFNPAIEAALKIADAPRYIVIERLAPFSGRSTDIDVIYDLMIHDLDLVGALLQLGPNAPHEDPLVEVRAIGVPIVTMNMDMTAARLAFSSGAVAQLSASRASLVPSRKIRLFTNERYISIDATLQTVKSVRRVLPTAAPEGDVEQWPELSGEEIEVETREDDALMAQLRDFVAVISAQQSGTPHARPRVDGVAGLRALRWADAVQRAVDDAHPASG